MRHHAAHSLIHAILLGLGGASICNPCAETQGAVLELQATVDTLQQELNEARQSHVDLESRVLEQLAAFGARLGAKENIIFDDGAKVSRARSGTARSGGSRKILTSFGVQSTRLSDKSLQTSENRRALTMDKVAHSA